MLERHLVVTIGYIQQIKEVLIIDHGLVGLTATWLLYRNLEPPFRVQCSGKRRTVNDGGSEACFSRSSFIYRLVLYVAMMLETCMPNGSGRLECTSCSTYTIHMLDAQLAFTEGIRRSPCIVYVSAIFGHYACGY